MRRRAISPTWIGWLYRLLFGLIVLAGALRVAFKPESEGKSIYVLARDIPPYHVFVAGDVVQKTLDADATLSDTIDLQLDPVGHYYTREAVRTDQPIRQSQVVRLTDPSLISNTVVVAIPGDATTLLGGTLRPGDTVMAATVPFSDTRATPAILFDQVLVLDVRSIKDTTVVLLAVPIGRWPEYLEKLRDRRIMLARPSG